MHDKIRNKNRTKLEKINYDYAQEISLAQTTNLRPYLIDLPQMALGVSPNVEKNTCRGF